MTGRTVFVATRSGVREAAVEHESDGMVQTVEHGLHVLGATAFRPETYGREVAAQHARNAVARGSFGDG